MKWLPNRTEIVYEIYMMRSCLSIIFTGAKSPDLSVFLYGFFRDSHQKKIALQTTWMRDNKTHDTFDNSKTILFLENPILLSLIRLRAWSRVWMSKNNQTFQTQSDKISQK